MKRVLIKVKNGVYCATENRKYNNKKEDSTEFNTVNAEGLESLLGPLSVTPRSLSVLSFLCKRII
jgi:hypothetical protein